ncbi:MAG: chorismate synthase, partial [Verrucomicrobia bacterium 21-51-4]
MLNTFGHLFRVTTWGESHNAGGLGAVIDGCPPGLPLCEADIQLELDRRRPGQNALSSPRKETDSVRILSGVHEGRTLGSPIALHIPNNDARPEAYKAIAEAYRPSHADYTYHAKYGIYPPSGGGRASARETAARVAAGAIAKKLLRQIGPIEITAYVEQVQSLSCPHLETIPTQAAIEATAIRCPDPATAAQMIALIESVRAQGDSVGGVIRCMIAQAPIGLGEPVFDRLEADLAKAMLSIPASKGFEIGSGFRGTRMQGSEHNDAFELKEGQIRTQSNYSGGIQGGISNGELIDLRVAFKPVATIFKPQRTLTPIGEPTTLQASGRHDPCVLPRAVPIVEAMAALVLVD